MKQLATLKVRAELSNVPLVIDCVTEAAREVGLDDHTLYQIQLAVDEACANVVQHAYEGSESGDMEVTCSLDEQGFSVCVRDWGQGFAPEHVPEPDPDAPLEERTLGGLGLFLMKQVMDSVHYSRRPGLGNELVFTKRLQVAE
jgi:anti-sigma regulatory factor (Ser/Thr protein kinase)